MQDNPGDHNSLDPGIERRLEAWAASPSAAPLSPEFERRLQSLLAPSLSPVKPLPSQSRLVLLFLAVFALSASALMGIMSKIGFHLMTAAQMGWTMATLTAAAILFSFTLAWRMVPGSRQGVPFPLVLTLSGIMLAGGIAALFPWRSSDALVSEGWPCAVMEAMVAIPATVVFGLLARRGALFASAGLGAALTGLGVVLALTPLQFQCMFQQAPHLLLWHAGTAALLIALGAMGGDAARRLQRD